MDTYLDALQDFPDNADMIQITRGTATLIKKDIFKNLMWYVLPDSNKQYPLTIRRVKEIKSLNARGIKPDELEAVEVVSGKPKEVEPEFVDVVGQISLRSLERSSKKKQHRDRDNRGGDRRDNRGGQQRPDNRNQPRQENRPQQRPDNRGGQQRPDNRNQPRQENRPQPRIEKKPPNNPADKK